ncbi:MAG: T9SS type A sorting domain-containing protein [Bacteroidetes bacterium]|nr:T9SS type A sorting domain-containing protein [Bacteroidota bacterium]
MKNTLYTVSLVLLCLVLSSWGSKGHKIISRNFSSCLPGQMSFLEPTWTNFVMNHASDADIRKNEDPDEAPRHYIDIDNYPEFIQTGHIPQTFDSVVLLHGYAFVIDQGILPFSTLITFDSLKNCFQRGNWDRADIFAADLGHYVGDGHMPLHITKNYNGQLTGQTGIHSRYESTLVSRYEGQLVYPADSVHFVDNVNQYVFDYIYGNYKYVDSLLLADTYAKGIAGNTSSDAYYQALWARSGSFTILMMQNASSILADLIYTAWVQAGSPVMYPVALEEQGSVEPPFSLDIYPNPVNEVAWFSVMVHGPSATCRLEIFDMSGNLVDTIIVHPATDGIQEISYPTGNLASGTYVCVLKSGQHREAGRFIVKR